MPNHITHKITISWENEYLDKFEKDVIVKKEWNYIFDFNWIIPQPSNIINSNITNQEIDEYRRLKIPIRCDWNDRNWGTKWNAYSFYMKKRFLSNDNLEIVFNTARDTPLPIWEKIKELYPELNFKIEYADEDIGNNCWIIKIYKWKIKFISKDWCISFAKRIRNLDKWIQIEQFIT